MSETKRTLKDRVHNAFRLIKLNPRGYFRAYMYGHVTMRMDYFFAKIWLGVSRNRPLRNIIVIESHNDFDCNSGAFYDYCLRQGYNEDWIFVWLLKNKKKRVPKNVKQFKLYAPSFRKMYYVCCAKYILNDDTFIEKRRADQICVYCTHGGCTFKNVHGLIVVPEYVDYALSSSVNYDPFEIDNFSIKENTKMLHLGFPSNDTFFQEEKNAIEECYGGLYKKIILWMPTFRKSKNCRNDSEIELEYGLPILESLDTFQKLNEILKGENSLLLLKIHPMQDIRDLEPVIAIRDQLSNFKIVLPTDAMEGKLDSYTLMKFADAMISDYSSVAYTYILRDKPLAFVLSDLIYYKPGFAVPDMERFLPGTKIYSFEDFVGFIKLILKDEKDPFETQRVELKTWMYEHADGDSSKRLAEFLGME